MSLLPNLTSFVSRKSTIATASSAFVLLLLLPLAGCSGEGSGEPIISSLSTPTDSTGRQDSDQIPNSAAAVAIGEEDPIISMTSTPTGVMAQVSWDRPSGIEVTGYTIFYGKSSSEKASSEESDSEESSSEEPSACSDGESQTVGTPPITITGLESNTRYFFAIRAFNQSESLCSNEFTVKTPPAES